MTTFVDTNVFVYARDSGQTSKQPIARHWLDHLWMSGTGRLSVQVLNEYYVTVTRKLSKVLPVDAARAEVGTVGGDRPGGDCLAGAGRGGEPVALGDEARRAVEAVDRAVGDAQAHQQTPKR